ncbi:hypothetical protein J1N35_013716 [Gossypium stocksii]|uniref:Uncharacterized protein n=1 Tax=Gossypium stocksii TaxID=47602 RepID=A0A9D3VTF5_9ROSI|nr:hypothetical protein J1N35_013716 [Gossypium stocksii]
MVNSFDKMSMLVSIKQPKRINEIIYLEVEKTKFPIRIIEMGLSKFKGDNRKVYGVKGREKHESVQEKDDTFVSESESKMRSGLEQNPEER